MPATIDHAAGWTELPTTHRHVDPSKPKPPTAEQLADAERMRRDRRDTLKQQKAAAELAELERQKFTRAIADVNARKEAFAAEHVATAAPLQARLKVLESQQIGKIVARLPADSSLEIERDSILSQLREMNASLEEVVRREDSILEQLEGERLAAAKKCDCGLIDGELFQLARSELRIVCEVSRSAHNWATARFTKSQERLAHKHSPFWAAAEVDAAAREVERTNTEVDAAYRVCVDE